MHRFFIPKEWIEEKMEGQFSVNQVTSIPLKMLRQQDIKGILDILLEIKNFNKIIINAVDYTDLKIFLVALSKSINRGKKFLFYKF